MDSCKSFCHFPLLFVVLLAGGFFVCYAIGVSNGNLPKPPAWPYVSDTGSLPPESCIFTLIITWASFFTLLSMYFYYKYVIQCDSQSKCNIASVIVGGITCFGITMVGAFQWNHVLVPHLIGALVAFIGAVIYSCMIIYISWRQLAHKVHSKGIVYVRIVIAVLEIISFIVLVVGTILMQSDPKYTNVSTISEWILIYLAIIFVGTLAYDLRHIRSATVSLIIINEAQMTSLNLPQIAPTYQSTGTLHEEP